jgi:hypothetical protein
MCIHFKFHTVLQVKTLSDSILYLLHVKVNMKYHNKSQKIKILVYHKTMEVLIILVTRRNNGENQYIILLFQ